MDRDFMRQFYRSRLPEVLDEATGSDLSFRDAEQQLESRLQGMVDEPAREIYRQLSDLSGNIERMLCEELYLKGAEDREKMLR